MCIYIERSGGRAGGLIDIRFEAGRQAGNSDRSAIRSVRYYIIVVRNTIILHKYLAIDSARV